MKRSLTILLLGVLLPILHSQPSIYYFNCTDDGSLFAWTVRNGITNDVILCKADSLYTVAAKTEPGLPLNAQNVKLSGNGKYIFWSNGQQMFRATIHPQGLTDTTKFNYPSLSQSGYDVSYDGSQVLACYDGPNIPKRCSPGFRMLMNFELRNGAFEVTDTLSPSDTCDIVFSTHLLPNGYVFWTTFTTHHLMQPVGQGQYSEISFLQKAPVRNRSFVIPANGNSIFIQGYADAPGSKRDSVFALYECRFINGKYADPVLVREWKNSPRWQTQVSVTPDGNCVVWTQIEMRENTRLPRLTEAYAMHRSGNGWLEPELLFSEYAGPSGRQLGHIATISNTNAVWMGYEGHAVFCTGLHSKALVANVTLINRGAMLEDPQSITRINLRDTLMEKEPKLLHLTYVNTTDSVLQVDFVPQHFPYNPNHQVMPKTDRAWLTLVADFPELSTSSTSEGQHWILHPGDTLRIPALMSFYSSGQLHAVSIYVRGGSSPGVVRWIIRPGIIVKDTRRSPFDPVTRADGKITRQCTRTLNGYQMEAWYPNGQLHFHTEYNADGRVAGTWRYYSETGVLLLEKKYRNPKTYTVKMWYENGQLRSIASWRESCRTGTWKEYYDNGAKKSEAVFRNVRTLNLYKGRLKVNVTFGTYAHSYTEWYANGQTMRHVSYGMNGKPKGKWESWYEGGQRNAVWSDHNGTQFTNQTIYDVNGAVCDPKNGTCTNLLILQMPNLNFEEPRAHSWGRHPF